MSSTLVYNSIGTIDQKALENLEYPAGIWVDWGEGRGGWGRKLGAMGGVGEHRTWAAAVGLGQCEIELRLGDLGCN